MVHRLLYVRRSDNGVCGIPRLYLLHAVRRAFHRTRRRKLHLPPGTQCQPGAVLDDFSWTKGKHNLKFGINFRRNNITDFDFRELASFPATLLETTSAFAAGNWDLYIQNFPSRSSEPFVLSTLGFYRVHGVKVEGIVSLDIDPTYVYLREASAMPIRIARPIALRWHPRRSATLIMTPRFLITRRSSLGTAMLSTACRPWHGSRDSVLPIRLAPMERPLFAAESASLLISLRATLLSTSQRILPTTMALSFRDTRLLRDLAGFSSDHGSCGQHRCYQHLQHRWWCCPTRRRRSGSRTPRTRNAEPQRNSEEHHRSEVPQVQPGNSAGYRLQDHLVSQLRWQPRSRYHREQSGLEWLLVDDCRIPGCFDSIHVSEPSTSTPTQVIPITTDLSSACSIATTAFR